MIRNTTPPPATIEPQLVQPRTSSPLMRQGLWFAVCCALLIPPAYWILRYTNAQGAPTPFAAILLLIVLLIHLSSTRISTYALLLPLSALMCAYIPVGMVYGQINATFMLSALATHLNESQEFLSTLPILGWILSLLSMSCIGAYLYLARRHHIHLYRSAWLNITLLISAALLPPSTPSSPLNFVQQVVESIRIVFTHDAQPSPPSAWGDIRTATPVYDDYVLVLGESARRDYFHSYGYAQPNTPFLDAVPGVFVQSMHTPAGNTIPSLTRMLTRSDPLSLEPNLAYNILDLIHSAGFETIWLSNQGLNGRHDFDIASRFAQKADRTVFLNRDSYTHAKSDFELVPALTQQLNTPTHQPRFIVLHTIGSHANVCQRVVQDYPPLPVAQTQHELACYIQSISKTDELIKRLYTTLQQHAHQTHRRFSLLYVADHGQVSQNIDGHIAFNHGLARQTYEVPMFKLSIDDTHQTWIHSPKSGIYFSDGLAHWLNIQHPQLRPQRLFTEQTTDPNHPIPTDIIGTDGQRHALKSLPDNPAINLAPNHTP